MYRESHPSFLTRDNPLRRTSGEFAARYTVHDFLEQDGELDSALETLIEFDQEWPDATQEERDEAMADHLVDAIRDYVPVWLRNGIETMLRSSDLTGLAQHILSLSVE